MTKGCWRKDWCQLLIGSSRLLLMLHRLCQNLKPCVREYYFFRQFFVAIRASPYVQTRMVFWRSTFYDWRERLLAMMQLLILKKFLRQRKHMKTSAPDESTNDAEHHVYSKDVAGVLMFVLVVFFLLMVAFFESPIYG